MRDNVTIVESGARQAFGRFLVRSIREIGFFRHALAYLVLNSLRNRYRRSYLGFLWSLLSPLFTMLVISIVFSALCKVELRSFGIYVFSGLLPWIFFSNSLTFGCNSLINAEGYMRKIYVAKIVFPIAAACTELVNLALSMVSLFILGIVFGAKAGWGLLFLPLAMVVTFLFVLGLVLVVSVWSVYFRDLPYIVQVALTALFYTVPVIYPLDLLPGLLQRALLFNPLYYFISLFHQCISEAKIPSLSCWGISTGLSLLSLIFGLYVLKARDRDLIYRL